MRKFNNNLLKVVSLLQDGAYHDGTSIGKTLRITRSAVWKAIKKLQDYQVMIDSVKGKGYALKQALILLDANKIKPQLKNDVELMIFESIHSTNVYLRTMKPKAITCCLAEQQTQGKGRMNRQWHSPFGQNIYLSCYFPFAKDISELSGLSLVTSLAIVKTLNCYVSENQFAVKWPNDVIYEGKKISGSLIEIQAESHGVCHAIIGIGINVNMLEDEDKIKRPWTSVQQITGQYVDRNVLVAQLINQLLAYLHEFSKNGFATFMAEWAKADCLMEKNIALQNNDHIVQGKVIGINAQGHLLLQTDENTVRAFSSGDTSVGTYQK